jgi:NAD(P)H-dependent flavin oxidoreductase YrpB (nitropropane dioxygenase family)
VNKLNSLIISGREVLPLVEGGKGIAISTGESSAAWTNAGAVGTFSGVNADYYDENGKFIPIIYRGKTRNERHDELISYAIRGGISQARIAHDKSDGYGCIHMNVLWEMGGAEHILRGVLDGARGLIHGVTCGAGMPYKLAEIVTSYGVYYYPIISSARALSALWRRTYHKFSEWLGAVVYEDPWLAGGHNGLSNSENPKQPQPPLPRVLELRATMRQLGIPEIPIFMAGGVWYLRDWTDFLDNTDVGPLAFQFGTRSLLTQESSILNSWKSRLFNLKPKDVLLHNFSPTGFYSSSIKNNFINELCERIDHQVSYSKEMIGDYTSELSIGSTIVYVKPNDLINIDIWITHGFNKPLRTPDSTLIFVTPERAKMIYRDQTNCVGCLSACKFSGWTQTKSKIKTKKADPRSFCIQKTLQSIAHGGDTDNELMFAGHSAHLFSSDPFYANGFIPTVRQLVDRIQTGD